MKVICLMHLLFLISLAKRNVKCPKFCSCKSEDAVCKGKKATFIPKFPRHVTSVTMRRSKLISLGENTLINLTFSPQVKKLKFSDNGIVEIHPNAFSSSLGLSELTVNNEKKLNSNVLMTALANMNDSSLEKLYLTNNNWYGLPKNMFGQFISSSIKELYLTGNRLYKLNCSIFSPLKRLKKLFMTSNYIETIDLAGLKNLENLNLEFNHLLKIPKFCSSNGYMTPYLEYLVLSNNFIVDINSSSLQCLNNLIYLGLHGSYFMRIENNTFASLPKLMSLSIGNALWSLKIIEDCAFNSSSLKKLALFGKFDFNGKSYNPSSIFAYNPNLIHLYLSGNSLKFAKVELRSMIKPLQKLESLILSNTQLKQMPLSALSKLSTLKRLVMDNNGIDGWIDSEQIFGINPITNLSLRSNSIAVINKTSFSKIMWKSLLWLDLSVNPFSCTCDQMWFRNWIKNRTIHLVGYPQFYRCESPNNMKGVLLEDYIPTIKSCTPWSPLFIIIVSVSSACAFVLFVIGIVYRCQTNIRNRLYLLRVQLNKRKGYIPLGNTEDFEYHAFVVYCEADSKWVHTEFLKRMEIEEGMRLCVHHRDFDVGEAITNNIDTYLQKSMKVVVVMSNNFAKSDWCQWEIDVVQERRRRQGKNAFLLIMLKNIDSKHMTSSLRTLLESTPHLTYQTGIGGKLFWKAAIETLRRPLGHPPTAVL